MVPTLASLFLWRGADSQQVVHLALGTSMASIVVTSFSSMLAHHKKAGVLWPVVRAMTPGILIGTFIATYLVAHLNSIMLAGIFSLLMLLVALQMSFGGHPKPKRGLPSNCVLTASGAGIGWLSALISIGGGTLSVPFLFWHNVALKQAIGTSAAIGVPIAASGTAGYLLHGWHKSDIDTYTFGFVFLPAVACISVASALTAPIGVRLAYHLPVATVRRVFAVFLFLLSAKMLWLLV